MKKEQWDHGKTEVRREWTGRREGCREQQGRWKGKGGRREQGQLKERTDELKKGIGEIGGGGGEGRHRQGKVKGKVIRGEMWSQTDEK